MYSKFPNIELSLNQNEEQSSSFYSGALRKLLAHYLPSAFFSSGPVTSEMAEEKLRELKNLLPVVRSYAYPDKKGFSLFMLCKPRENVFKFFFDVVDLWILPGRKVPISTMYAADFRIKEFGEELFAVCEISMRTEEQELQAEILRNLPVIEQEVSLGIQSRYQAERIAMIKGISHDEKKQFIHSRLTRLISRFQDAFDKDLLLEMQHFFILSPKGFKAKRDPQALAKAISTQYIFRKDISEQRKEHVQKRFTRVKLYKSNLYTDEGERSVLSCVIAINFLQKEHETINEQLILSAMHNYLPSIQIVPDSLVVNRRPQDPICTIYLEVEKATGAAFTLLEMKHLKQELLIDLGDRVSHLMHPIFMPRNEEEIMRNVLTLSQEVRYISDLPQVIITFDHQMPGKLLFTVILVRISAPGDMSIEEKFAKICPSLHYIHDRVKMLSMLRKKYAKEATIFQVTVPSQKFLRKDQTIDLSRARQEVVDELTKVIGEFRDYNGGMISKQNEALAQLISHFIGKKKKFNQLLLENLFYSLTPVVMRTILPSAVLGEFFSLLNEATYENVLQAEYSKKIFSLEKDEYYYIWVCSDSLQVKKQIERSIRNFPRSATSLTQSFMQIYEIHYCGFLLHSRNQEDQALLRQVLQNALEEANANNEDSLR